jgi:hypothetical protein
MDTRIKVRPLTPNERTALEQAQAVVKPMCDLFRMVSQQDWSPATLGADGELRKRFFELEERLKTLPCLIPMPDIKIGRNGVETKESRQARETVSAVRRGDVPPPVRKPLFAEHEKMRLGDGYSDHDKERIRTLASRFVEGRVLKGEVNPENDVELKAAVKKAGLEALQAYNAALEFLSG